MHNDSLPRLRMKRYVYARAIEEGEHAAASCPARAPVGLMPQIAASTGGASHGVPDLQALALRVQHALLHRLRPDIRPGALLPRALMCRLWAALEAQPCVVQSQTHHLQHTQAISRGGKHMSSCTCNCAWGASETYFCNLHIAQLTSPVRSAQMGQPSHLGQGGVHQR